MRIIDTEEKPIYLWLENIEDGAMEQAKDLANLPFCFHHVAVMPDAHQGYGMPIGGVFAAEEKVIPNAVGVDIGCGMCAVKTSLTAPHKKRAAHKDNLGNREDHTLRLQPPQNTPTLGGFPRSTGNSRNPGGA